MGIGFFELINALGFIFLAFFLFSKFFSFSSYPPRSTSGPVFFFLGFLRGRGYWGGGGRMGIVRGFCGREERIDWLGGCVLHLCMQTCKRFDGFFFFLIEVIHIPVPLSLRRTTTHARRLY